MAKKQKKKSTASREKERTIQRYDHVLTPNALKHVNAKIENENEEYDTYGTDSTHPIVLHRVDADYYDIGPDDGPNELFSESIDGLPLTGSGRDGEEFEIGVYRLVDIKRVRIRVEEVKDAKK